MQIMYIKIQPNYSQKRQFEVVLGILRFDDLNIDY